jgi:hypothetical protein
MPVTITSVHEDCANAIRDVIAALTFQPMVAYNIYIQWTESEANIQFPAIVLALDGMPETDESRLNATFDIGYPVRVMILDRVGPTDQSKTSAHLLARMRIIRAFQGQQLAAVVQNWICRVEFDPVFRNDTAKFEFLVSELVVRAVCREPAGINA